MSETIDILTDERRCRDCLEFEQFRFLEKVLQSQAGGTTLGWCKKTKHIHGA